MNALQAGSITFSTALDNAQLEKELSKLAKRIAQTEQMAADLTLKLDRAKSQSLFQAGELDAEKAKLQEIKNRLAEIKALSKDKTLSAADRAAYAARIPAVQQELSDQQTRVNLLQTEWNKTENAVERYERRLSEAGEKLDRQKEEAGELTRQLKQSEKAQSGMSKAADRAGTYMGRFLDRVKRLASRVFVFTVITSALRSLRTWLVKTVKSDKEASAAIGRLKGALLTLAPPLIQVIIPAFTALVNVLAKVVSVIANVVSKLFGSNIQASNEAAKGLYKEMKALDGVGKAAKGAEKAMASFDEINQISDGSADGANGTKNTSSIAPDFGSVVRDGLNSVIELFAGAALLALGAILTFTGTAVFLGLALMAIGAIAVVDAVTADPALLSSLVEGGLDIVLTVIGPMIAVIGVILAVMGCLLPGIALIIAGIALFELGCAAGENGDFVENIRSRLVEGAKVAGGLIAVIGLFLLVMGNIAPGLGLFIAGIALFEFGDVADDDGKTMQEKIVGVLKGIAGAVSPVLAIVGLALLTTGHILPGLSLVIAGVALFEAATAADDDGKTMREKIVSVLEEIADVVAPLLAIVGLFLAVTGRLILGLALIVAGVAIFEWKEASDDDGKTMQEKIVSVLKKTAEAVGPFVAIIGLILLVTGRILLGLALVIAGAAIFEAAKVADDDGMTMQEKITTVLNRISGVVAAASAALLVLGIILLFTGAGIPLGLGMIALGAVGLAAALTPNWDFILNKLKDIWNGIKNWWNSNVKEFFTTGHWKNLGKDIMNGFLDGLKKAWDAVVTWATGVVDWFKGLFKGASDSAANVKTPPNSAPSNQQRTASQMYSQVSDAFSAQRLSIPQIPKLARGAVIPPNREFLAVLGDQKSGANIEAPASLIKQMVMEGIASAGSAGIRGGDVHVTLELDRRELGRVVFRLNHEESQRIGVNLAGVRT